MERMLKSDETSKRNLIQDRDLFISEIKQKKELIDKHAPKKLRGANQNKALAKAKKLAERIKKKLPDNQMKQIMYPKSSDGYSKHQDFESAVKAEMAFMMDKNLQSDVREYKYLMQRIDPDSPGVGSIEALREGRHVRIRR